MLYSRRSWEGNLALLFGQRELIGFYMESIDQNYDDSVGHTSNRKLIPPSSPDLSNIVGAPQSSPRIGHEYQVEVPSMIKESERLQLIMNDSELVNDNSHCIALDLSIPLIWVHNEVEDNGNEGRGYLGDNDDAVSVTVPAVATNVERNGISANGKELIPTTSQSVMTVGQLGKSKNCVMVPGTLNNSWSDADVKSFLLGIQPCYIRVSLVSSIVDELHALYVCVCTASAIDQLEWKPSAIWASVSKSYVEGRTSLEEYISSLKSTVGLCVLVEAVGIGKGSEDLTSPAVEPVKKNRVVSLPTSKVWSSLGPNDIIKFLTGGSRLSKSKSNELFWEAIWPRLLARGWHSEKLKSQGSANSKNIFVFLLPGVKKFSRRKLVKGDHYFDSVCDVFSKVIAEPNLLQLKVEEAKVSGCSDEEAEKGSSEDGQSDYHQHCYLKPHASTNNADHMNCTAVDTSLVHGRKLSDLRVLKSLHGNSVGKIDMTSNKRNKHVSKTDRRKGKLDSINSKLTKFTVVDTSLLQEGKLSKVREIKYPPVELEDTSKMTGISRESDRNFSNDISPSETEAAMIYSKRNSGDADWQKGKHSKNATGQKEVNVNLDNNANNMAENHGNQKTCVCDDNQQKGTIKHKFSRRARSGHSNVAVPPIKRRRLTACAKAETSRILDKSSGGLGSEKLGFSQSSCFPDANKKAGDTVSHKQDVTLASSSAEGGVELNNGKSFVSRVSLDKGISSDKVEKCESQPSINFNAPQVPVKSEDGEMMAMEEEDGQGLKPNDIIPRRQSTRNRPLTVRALESLANEFLHGQRKPKRKDTLTLEEPFSTCRRARTRV
ncbi:hypothetical protein VNO77_13625 [Canavalia gladiata]|uniref:Uncharacterized protein n=1 Tax=Canavalia gladiata TaxID=3824 RepID=A0AAN9QRP1_CANGL